MNRERKRVARGTKESFPVKFGNDCMSLRVPLRFFIFIFFFYSTTNWKGLGHKNKFSYHS